jgi:hypothetical protein
MNVESWLKRVSLAWNVDNKKKPNFAGGLVPFDLSTKFKWNYALVIDNQSFLNGQMWFLIMLGSTFDKNNTGEHPVILIIN